MSTFMGTFVRNILCFFRYYSTDQTGKKPLKYDLQPEESLPEFEKGKSAEELYQARVLEANMYLDHDLYNESLFLYKKLEKEWSTSNDLEKINLIRKKILTLNELVETSFDISFQPDHSSQVLYMDKDGSLTEVPSESEEKDPALSNSSRNLLLYKKLFPNENETKIPKNTPEEDKVAPWSQGRNLPSFSCTFE